MSLLGKKESGKSLHVIVLGAGGGPLEDNCTAFLVRSTALGWSRGSVLAVDTGVHLSAIDLLLQKYPSPIERPFKIDHGPLSGLELPCQTTGANTAHIARNLIGAHLLTHPHLDHISGGIISTSMASSKPKKIAGLSSTIQALQDHVFNDVIWPNLSDENGGVGLVTFLRLMSGGSSVLGQGTTKGYMEVVDGLAVKSWAVSHGTCIRAFPYQYASSTEPPSPTLTGKRPSLQSHHSQYSGMSTDALTQAAEALTIASTPTEQSRSYPSSACFIHDIASGQEILIWGDVEPDSISAAPRNKPVWLDAAPKIAAGTLKGIFIECSYDDSRPDDLLFGHMTPRYLIEELLVLATEVERYHNSDSTPRKRDRKSIPSLRQERENQRPSRPGPISIATATRKNSGGQVGVNALKGLKIVVIHLKETLDDKEDVRDVVNRQLGEYEEVFHLGCEFIVSEKGMSVYL